MSPVPTPSESPLQKSRVYCKNEGRDAQEGLVWGGSTSTLCPGMDRMEDAILPFLASKGVNLIEL